MKTPLMSNFGSLVDVKRLCKRALNESPNYLFVSENCQASMILTVLQRMVRLCVQVRTSVH